MLSFDPSGIAVHIVEDGPLLRWDAVDMLEEAGFIAYGAGNADQAIRLLGRRPEVQVLFTDVDMPGLRTVRERRKIGPDG